MRAITRSGVGVAVRLDKVDKHIRRADCVRSRASMWATRQANVANTGRAVAYSSCTRHKNHLLIQIDILAVYINITDALNAQFVFYPVVLHKSAVSEVYSGNVLLVGIWR